MHSTGISGLTEGTLTQADGTPLLLPASSASSSVQRTGGRMSPRSSANLKAFRRFFRMVLRGLPVIRALCLSGPLAALFIAPAIFSGDIRDPDGVSVRGPRLHNLSINPVSALADAEKQGNTMDFIEDPAKRTLTIMDAGVPVLTYRFGDQLKEDVDARFTRSTYIHPLFSLDGRELTADFPADHVHHHGLFWGWPVVKVRGQTTSNWEVGSPSLRQRFVRWLKREIDDGVAVLSVENTWELGESEAVAREIVTLRVHPADPVGRAIDIELLVTAVGGPLELQGTPDQDKGYGGLCFRSAPLLKGATMTTDKGPLDQDVVNTPFRWADISTAELGVAIFVAPGHPDAPVRWLIRNSYAGVINPSWPGLEPVTLRPGRPVVLRYRIDIHLGDAAAGNLAARYRLFAQAE